METIVNRSSHKSLVLADIAPEKSASYSPNLQKWMRAKGHFYKGGGVLQGVFRVKEGTALASEFGAGTLMIGYKDMDDERGFTGIRLVAALCEGAKAGSFYYAGMGAMLEEVNGFWDSYLLKGRCAIDPEHSMVFTSNRFSFNGDHRTCVWCGDKHARVMVPRTVLDETWVRT